MLQLPKFQVEETVLCEKSNHLVVYSFIHLGLISHTRESWDNPSTSFNPMNFSMFVFPFNISVHLFSFIPQTQLTPIYLKSNICKSFVII